MKKRFSLSKRAVIGCLLAVSAVTYANINVFASETKVSSQADQTEASQEVKNEEEFLIDSDNKNYSDLNKAERVSKFNFKVPDYAPEGFAADAGINLRKTNNVDYVDLSFSNEEKREMYSIEMYKEYPKDVLTYRYGHIADDENENTKLDVKDCEKSIGSIDGKDITITETFDETKKNFSVVNYFVWQDDGVYYAIEYSNRTEYDNEVSRDIEINEDDVLKIINSMKKPEDINNVKYFSENKINDALMNIYDREDADNAANKLGFTPKLVKNMSDDVRLDSAYLRNYNDGKLSFDIHYDVNDSYFVTVRETKESNDYDDIKAGNLVLYKSSGNTKASKSEKITVNNKEVYKVKEAVPQEYGFMDNEYAYVYVWEDNGIYYRVSTRFLDDSSDAKLESVISDILNGTNELK